MKDEQLMIGRSNQVTIVHFRVWPFDYMTNVKLRKELPGLCTLAPQAVTLAAEIE